MKGKGFGQPQYWIQVCGENCDRWIPWKSDYLSACAFAGKALYVIEGAEFVLVLDGGVRQGAIASKKQILAELQKEHRPGSKRLEVIL